MTIRLFFGSGPGFVNRTQSDPGFVDPVRSGPGFVNPIRSDPILVLLTLITWQHWHSSALVAKSTEQLEQKHLIPPKSKIKHVSTILISETMEGTR